MATAADQRYPLSPRTNLDGTAPDADDGARITGTGECAVDTNSDVCEPLTAPDIGHETEGAICSHIDELSSAIVFDTILKVAVAHGNNSQTVTDILNTKTVGDIPILLDNYIRTQHKDYKVPTYIRSRLGTTCKYSKLHKAGIEYVIKKIAECDIEGAITTFRALMDTGYVSGYIRPRVENIRTVYRAIKTQDVDKWYNETLIRMGNTTDALWPVIQGEYQHQLIKYALLHRLLLEIAHAEINYISLREKYSKSNATSYREQIARQTTLSRAKTIIDKEGSEQLKKLAMLEATGGCDTRRSSNNWFTVHKKGSIEVIPRYGPNPIIADHRTPKGEVHYGRGWMCSTTRDAIKAIETFITACCNDGEYDDEILTLIKKITTVKKKPEEQASDTK